VSVFCRLKLKIQVKMHYFSLKNRVYLYLNENLKTVFRSFVLRRSNIVDCGHSFFTFFSVSGISVADMCRNAINAASGA